MVDSVQSPVRPSLPFLRVLYKDAKMIALSVQIIPNVTKTVLLVQL